MKNQMFIPSVHTFYKNIRLFGNNVHEMLFTVRAQLHGSYSYLMLRDCRRCLRQICDSKLMLCLTLRVKNKPKKVAAAVTNYST